MKLKGFFSRLDLQARVVLVLIAVIVPTFLIVTLAENQFTQPLLEDELRQIGINAGKRLSAQIVAGKLLNSDEPGVLIENAFQEILFTHPSISRIDVMVKEPQTGVALNIASNIEVEPGTVAPAFPLVETVTSEFKTDEDGNGTWEINVPIETHTDYRIPLKSPRRRLLGSIHLVVTTQIVERIASAIWRTTAVAAAFSVLALVLSLSYFLRRTIANDRLLRQAESQNLELSSQLQEAQRQLMNSEKLAVMGQLTASFAHEIGTPLNAIGGHLQLLEEETPGNPRVEILQGQVEKIEGIVKNFLQVTAKPASQRQLVDVNQLVNKTISFVRPRLDGLEIEVRARLDRGMGPIRAVPMDLEQILLNLVNNSIDSLKSKRDMRDRARLQLEVETESYREGARDWARVSVYDTGEGISKLDLPSVAKPFFTTKGPGEGTGLGLTICRQLAHKYGGELELDSKEGAWTRATLRVPLGTQLS